MSSSPSLACAAYVRTSTDDNQSPEDSKRWQLDIATRLLTPVGGTIVATYHDIDVTRERPWARRPEAARLLADAANPGRGWSAVVIAEPQRAFSGGQFQLVFPQLAHYGIELWVPELGGRIDPDSEGHEMLMGLFGGLSKAERRRLQIRTRNAMLAHGAAGRWLGGRPNYGYRLVDTDQPHPQRQKATAGIKLRVLEPDRDTAPVVRRIFQLFDEGAGYRSIATILERDGLPSPGEVGPTRHPRSAGVWGGSAVRAILTNPRYLGHQVTGRQRRKDELLDPTAAMWWRGPDLNVRPSAHGRTRSGKRVASDALHARRMSTASEVNPTDPATVVEEALRRLNDHDLDGYYALCADDFRYVGTAERVGHAAAREVDEPMFAAVPDHWRRIDKLIVGGDVVAVWLTLGGTPTATGQAFEAEFCDIIEVRDGLIQSLTLYADWPGLFRNFAPSPVS